MEPLLIVLVPGLLGGLGLALLIARNHWKQPAIVVPRRLAAPSPAAINMAHIPVEGIGGLGIVAAVVAVAITEPHIRLATILAWILGVGLAIVLIALRQSNGSLPSGGDDPDDRSTLHIDGDRWKRRADRRTRLDPLERALGTKLLAAANTRSYS
jgi:hypothetical protein